MTRRTFQALPRLALVLLVAATFSPATGATPGPRDPAIRTLVEHRLAERDLGGVSVTVEEARVVQVHREPAD